MLKIFKRKLNKNAKSQPQTVKDYYHGSARFFSQDGTSFACIDKIASEFAGLSYGVYDNRTREKIKRSSVYALLKQPNLEDRHYNFFYQSVIDYFNGGVFWLKSEINGEVVSLFRLNPLQVKLNRDLVSNKRIYEYNGAVYTDAQVLYIPSRFGYSTKYGGQSIFNAIDSVFKTASDIDNFTRSSFSTGVLGKRTVIDVSGAFPNLTKEQAADIKSSFQSEYAGPENAGRPILKKKGIEYSEIGSSTDNNAAQLTENRKYQEHEIAKLFGVPESLLTVSEDSDLENTFTLFLEFAIKPLVTQFQEAISSLLDEDRYYFEFDYNSIMKVSLQNRIDAYTKQINNGLLSPNEARAKENLSPIEAGDTFFMPVNMMPLNNETINAYMAKQKNEINNTVPQSDTVNPTEPDAQHFGGGDDKQ